MPMSPFVSGLRSKIGSDLLLLPSASIVVFDEHRRVLLARDADSGLWMIVGGAIEPDEAPADAAVREFWEETGGVVELVRLIGVFGGPGFRKTYPNGDQTAYVVSLFEGRLTGGTLRPDGVETTEIGWFSAAETATLATNPITRALLAFAFGGVTSFQPATFRPDA